MVSFFCSRLKFFKNCNFILIIAVLFGLSACNSDVGGANGTNASQNLKLMDSVNDSNVATFSWILDGRLATADDYAQVKDTAWHLLTINVTSAPQGFESRTIDWFQIKVPSTTYGQAIELQDINCKGAKFTKVGDSCSVHFRQTYNQEKYPQVTSVLFYNILMGLFDVKGEELSSLRYTTSITKIDNSVAEYRAILPIESEYFAGSQVQSNKNLYQILMLQNVKPLAVNLTTLSTPQNPKFTLMHRLSTESTDVYYAGFNECSLVANPTLNQVNRLESTDDKCILVYKVDGTSTNSVEKDVINVATDAKRFYPGYPKIFNLIANYINGTPLPDQYVTLQQSPADPNTYVSPVVKTTLPFKTVNVNYVTHGITITSLNKLPNGILLPKDTTYPLWSRIFDGPNMFYISGYLDQYPDGTQLGTDSKAVSGDQMGGWYNYTINARKDLTAQGLLSFTVTYTYISFANCNFGTHSVTQNYSFNTGGVTIASGGCSNCCTGGSDPGSANYNVTLNGISCNGANCQISLNMHTEFGRSGGWRRADFPSTITIPQPTLNKIATTTSPLDVSSSYKLITDEYPNSHVFNVQLSNVSNLPCSEPIWNGSGYSYCGAFNSTAPVDNMSISSNKSEEYNLSFIRSSGYDLNDFNIVQQDNSKKGSQHE